MSRAAKAKAAGGGHGRWLQGLVCGALVTLATPTALLGGVLLLPAIIVYLLDDAEARPTLRAVSLFGIAASWHPLFTLWTGGHSLALSLSLLSDVARPAVAWSAQGAGWLLSQIIPLLVRATLEAQTRIEVARLRAEREKLAEEWELPSLEGDTSAAG